MICHAIRSCIGKYLQVTTLHLLASCVISNISAVLTWQLIGWSWKSWPLWDLQPYFWSLSHSFATRNGSGESFSHLSPVYVHSINNATRKITCCQYMHHIDTIFNYSYWDAFFEFIELFDVLTRVKTEFYPDIPEPKLPGDWSRTQVSISLIQCVLHSLSHYFID